MGYEENAAAKPEVPDTQAAPEAPATPIASGVPEVAEAQVAPATPIAPGVAEVPVGATVARATPVAQAARATPGMPAAGAVFLVDRERWLRAVACFLWLQVLMHIVYGVSYVGNIQFHLELAARLKQGEFGAPWGDENTWLIHSPVFLFMAPLFGFKIIDSYLIAVYVVTQTVNLLVCWLVSRFDIKYALLFMSAGWGVTVAWWMGYPDILSILFLLLLYRHTTAEKLGWRGAALAVLWMVLMTFNHATIASLSVLILTLLAKDKKRILPCLIIGYAAGAFLINQYLASINYAGFGRLDALLRPPHSGLVRAPAFMNANFPWVVYSAFYGVLLYAAVMFWRQPPGRLLPVIAAVVVALGGATLGADTSRLLSIFVVPIVLFLLDDAQKNPFANPHINKSLFAAALVLPILIGEYHIWEGAVYHRSPFFGFSILDVLMEAGQKMLTDE